MTYGETFGDSVTFERTIIVGDKEVVTQKTVTSFNLISSLRNDPEWKEVVKKGVKKKKSKKEIEE